MSYAIKILILGMIMSSTLTGCMVPYHQQQGATAGGAIGGIAGAVLDHRNPWRGGVIGAAIGALTGATLAEVSYQASRQAAEAGGPVEYSLEGGAAYYYAEPIGYDDDCRQIREKIYQNGVLVQKRIILVCDDYPRYKVKHKHKHKKKKHHKYDDEDDD